MKTLLSIKIYFIITIALLFMGVDVRLSAAAEDLRVHFIDVGYADAILIELPGDQVMAIDTGDPRTTGKLLDYIRSVGINKIDKLIITHSHANHYGGVPDLLETIDIKEILLNDEKYYDKNYAKLLSLINEKNIATRIIKKGDTVEGLGLSVELKVLHPHQVTRDLNDSSLVTLLRYKEKTFLFTADIEKKSQNTLIRENPQLRTTDCVHVPHHGVALTKEFITFFDNPIYVVTTGRSFWGRPSERDLKKLGDRLFRTDRDGTVVLSSDGQSIKVVQPKISN